MDSIIYDFCMSIDSVQVCMFEPAFHTYSSKMCMSPCSDGMGRTGAFICLHAQIEKLKTEGVIDCFQFIKSARLNRPGLVQSVVSLWENASCDSLPD